MIVGHEAARAALEKELPSVTLLLGPSGTGKRTLAEHAICHHDIHRSNVIRVHKLDAETARAVVQAMDVIPQGGLKVIFIDLDGAGEAAQNILLKALEEAPDQFRFILIASAKPLDTIVSRSQAFRSGYLESRQVAAVLTLLGKDPALARLSRGTVSGALAAGGKKAEDAERENSVVAAVLRAARAGEWEAMNRAMRGWTPQHTQVLLEWSADVGGYGAAFPEASALMTRGQARRVWRVLRRSPLSALMVTPALRAGFGGLPS